LRTRRGDLTARRFRTTHQEHSMPTLHSAIATPSQQVAAAARRERERKIAAKAHPDFGIACPSASVRSGAIPLSPPPVSADKGNAPQRAVGPRGRIWFWIVEEIDPRSPPRVSIEDIQGAVERHCKVGHLDLISARRTASLVRPRQIAMFLARHLTPNSLPVIGRQFGGRDHTTVLHAVRKIEWLRTRDKTLAGDIEAIARALARAA
jgi:hypothetical protein